MFGSFDVCQPTYHPVEGGIGGPVVYAQCQQEDYFPKSTYTAFLRVLITPEVLLFSSIPAISQLSHGKVFAM